MKKDNKDEIQPLNKKRKLPSEKKKVRKEPRTKATPVNKIWDDSMYVEFHRHLSEGLTVEQTAETMGLNINTVNLWIREKPALKKIIEESKLQRSSETTTERIVEYIYMRLPENLQLLWKQLERIEDEPTAARKIESILADQGQCARQRLFLYALIASNFQMLVALRRVNINKRTLDNWCEDPEFNDLLREMEWHQKHFVEGQLMTLIAERHPAATIFANKALNRERYNPPTESIHSGSVKHDHDFDFSKLSVDLKRKVLEEIRQSKIPKPLAIEQPTIIVKAEPNDSESTTSD
jgi:hypothetical protein